MLDTASLPPLKNASLGKTSRIRWDLKEQCVVRIYDDDYAYRLGRLDCVSAHTSLSQFGLRMQFLSQKRALEQQLPMLHNRRKDSSLLY